jgi:hypothetical protein
MLSITAGQTKRQGKMSGTLPCKSLNLSKTIQTITVLLNTNGERCHSNISARSSSTDEASYNMLMLLFPKSSLFDEVQMDMMKTSQNSWYYTL